MSVGHVGLCKGGFMASSDEIYIRIVGKGGHAAQPKMTNNPIYASFQSYSGDAFTSIVT